MPHFLRKILENKFALYWIVLFVDLYIVFNMFILAYFIYFSFNFEIHSFFKQLPFVLIFSLFSFFITKSYKGLVHHTIIKNMVLVTISSVVLFLLLIIVEYVSRALGLSLIYNIPYFIIAIHFLLNIAVLIISRILFKKIYYLLIGGAVAKQKTLIYGIEAAGLLTFKVLQNDKNSQIKVVGFIDENSSKTGKMIHGLKVYPLKKIDKNFIVNKQVQNIIIAIKNIPALQLMKISGTLSKLPVSVNIVPPSKSWFEGSFKAQQIKKIQIEDLLGREHITFENKQLTQNFKNKVILVTGAAGSIGSELARQLANYEYAKLVLIDQAESDLYDVQQELKLLLKNHITCIVADVRNYNRMEVIFKKYKPQIVFHAAAYKHVPLMENFPIEAVAVNVIGTKHIADLSMAYNAEDFVMISTDKAVNPTNVMGATKRIAEMYISNLQTESGTKFMTTRFGNVLGSNGSVIPLFKKQIEQGGPITLTHKEITRYFMTIPEACQLVLEAGTMGKGGEIFVFNMGESVKIYDLAKNMIRLSGLNHPKDIAIKIIGLRPGEKIYEELLSSQEDTLATYHEKIMIAKVRKKHTSIVQNKIIELCELSSSLNTIDTVAKMKAIVPEYVSNNSEFEYLDK